MSSLATVPPLLAQLAATPALVVLAALPLPMEMVPTEG